MRGHLTLVREAELLVSSPERVYSWLEERTAALSNTEDEGDEAMEQALLERGEPLVDIALARFCQCDSTAHTLFTQSNTVNSQQSHACALRLAVLSNTVLGGIFSFAGLPGCLFDSNDDGLVKWLGGSSDPEIAALFGNSNINELFVRDFLEGKAAWQAMDVGRRMAAIRSLSGNPRMKSIYSGDMDGFAEHSYNSVFHAAWKLTKTLPPTPEWAMVLGYFLDILPREAYGMEDALHVAERWHPAADDVRGMKAEPDAIKNGFVSSYGLVRQALADLACTRDEQSKEDFFNSGDFAFRAVAYCKSQLSAEQILSAYERDKNLAVNCCLENFALWRNPDLRKIVQDISWKACAYNNDYMDSANAFNRKASEMETRFPNWFKDVDSNGGVDADELATTAPATKADVQGVADALANNDSLLREKMLVAENTSGVILARLGWVFWFSLGALVAALWNKF